MTLTTDRLILRPWEESDADDLFRYVKDPDIGPPAGWPAHKTVEESRNIIKTVLSDRETYAVCLKSDNRPIGAIALKLKGNTDFTDRDDECELGYWVGKPFWGQGIIPEAGREILRRAFENLGMCRVWCAYYEGNSKSKRVQEKLGFKYQWTSYDVDVPLLGEKRTGYVNAITRDEWMKLR